MKTDFGSLLLRLKEQVGMHSDKEVAALLGLSVKAFHARKTRNSFPEDKLFSVATKHPELNIDIDYVLTGVSAKRSAARMLQNFGPRLKEVRGDRTPAAFAKLLGVTTKDLIAIESGERPPTTAEALSLQRTHPDRSVKWLFGGDAPRLDRQPDHLEIMLLQNYRASTDEAREFLRQQAAFYASLNNDNKSTGK